MEERLSRWENINLSLGGRIVLINSILTNLPIYALSFHKIPKTILLKLTRVQRRFLWGGCKGTEKKIPWVKWAVVCREKKRGGLGIKNLEWFNLALFGKWGWKALSEKESLVSKVLDSKYGDFLECCERFSVSKKSDPYWSSWWLSLIKFVGTNKWFRDNVSRTIGDGNDTKFWYDKWLGGRCFKDMFPRLFLIDINKLCSVADRLSMEENGWKYLAKWRRNLFVWEEEQAADLEREVCNVRLKNNLVDDWSWDRDKTRAYSVKTAYEVLAENNREDNTSLDKLKIVWNKSVPTKIASFSWKVLQDRIPSILNLLKRGSYNPFYSKYCKTCGNEDEDTDHIFFDCTAAKSVWFRVHHWLGHSYRNTTKGQEHLEEFTSLFENHLRQVGNLVWQCTIWFIWHRRNSIIFR
ncbi:hypothetical protein ACS0TY_025841 [Phlomoides rotata]